MELPDTNNSDSTDNARDKKSPNEHVLDEAEGMIGAHEDDAADAKSIVELLRRVTVSSSIDISSSNQQSDGQEQPHADSAMVNTSKRHSSLMQHIQQTKRHAFWDTQVS